MKPKQTIIDMHVHIYSHDSDINAKEAILRAEELGIDLLITDHYSYLSSEPLEDLREFARAHNVRLYRGAEAATSIGHMILLGVKDDSWNKWDGIEGHYTDAQELINYVNSIGGITIAAHPFKEKNILKTGKKLRELNGIYILEAYNGQTSDENNKKAFLLSQKLNYSITGGSDAHTIDEIGKCVTIFNKKINSLQDLIEELKKGNYSAKYLLYKKAGMHE